MSEVIDIHTGEPFCPHSIPSVELPSQSTRFAPKFLNAIIAVRNDQIRKRLSIRSLNFSYDLKCATNNLDNSVLKSICDQVRFSKFKHIDFGSMSDRIISKETRAELELQRKGGLLHAGDNPAVSVVWLLDNTKKQVQLLTAEEYFRNTPK